ncbi:unnamed protein product [Protopolystoma xenopodis]|uniref:Secreted protein n=1 Tax=Protopolystoma xenopodis TaxID=117903 RepID=A0A448XB87_9PLAT|nr:unnamed protein product [Protopolystoma xenopodis]
MRAELLRLLFYLAVVFPDRHLVSAYSYQRCSSPSRYDMRSHGNFQSRTVHLTHSDASEQAFRQWRHNRPDSLIHAHTSTTATSITLWTFRPIDARVSSSENRSSRLGNNRPACRRANARFGWTCAA